MLEKQLQGISETKSENEEQEQSFNSISSNFAFQSMSREIRVEFWNYKPRTEA